MAVDPNIKKKADDIRNKIYGKEVRESLASGLEAMSSDIVENEGRQSVVEGRQDSVESQFQDVIENTTDKDVISAPEIIAARDGEANLKARLDKTIQYTHVGFFGAVGDGVTDDTIAIRNAIASVTESSVLTLDPGKRYRITQPLEIDAEKIRMVLGNNAYIFVDGDFEAIKYKGNKTSGGTGPNLPIMYGLKRKEMSTIIKDMQIYSKATLNGNYPGTGLVIEDQHSPVLVNCHFFNLNYGVVYRGKNVRNIIIESCHFWDNRTANILFEDGGEVHQCLISNSHISYAKYGILLENYLMYNLHLSNVSMEAQQLQNDGFASFIKSTGGLDEFFVSNCNFQDHEVGTGWLFDIDGFKRVGINNSYISYSSGGGLKFVNGSQLLINGNIFDRLDNDAIYLEDVLDFTVDSNSFKDITGQAIRLRGSCEQFTIKGNTANNINGLFDADLDSVIAGIVESNNVRPTVAPALHIKTTENMRNLKVNNNTFYWHGPNYNSTEWAVDIECGGSMSGFHFMNNSLSARSQGATSGFNGFKITVGVYDNSTFIKNNATDEIKVSAGKQAFDFPLADSERGVIIADNVDGRPR